MSRPYLHKLCIAAFITTLGTLVASLASWGGGTTPRRSPPGPDPLSQKVQHVVVIVQENRTPDNLFHGLPGADIADAGVTVKGRIIPLKPISLASDYDLSHTHEAFVQMYDGGRMDGAAKIGVTCLPNAIDCPSPDPQFMYVDPSEVIPYFQLAEQYTFGDRMFQTNQGPSFPAHQFLIAGTSAPTPTSNLFAAENPNIPQPNNLLSPRPGTEVGCDAPKGSYVFLIDPLGGESSWMRPCFEHGTLVDLLDSRMISWRYYAPAPGSIWVGPNAIHHLRFGPDWVKNVVINKTQVLTDIASGQLPQVSWVIPTGQASDHPTVNDG